jgi:hypothetical protein
MESSYQVLTVQKYCVISSYFPGSVQIIWSKRIPYQLRTCLMIAMSRCNNVLNLVVLILYVLSMFHFICTWTGSPEEMLPCPFAITTQPLQGFYWTRFSSLELQLSTNIACVDYIYVNSVPALAEQNEQSNMVCPILYELKREKVQTRQLKLWWIVSPECREQPSAPRKARLADRMIAASRRFASPDTDALVGRSLQIFGLTESGCIRLNQAASGKTMQLTHYITWE